MKMPKSLIISQNLTEIPMIFELLGNSRRKFSDL